jgi:putative transcriptional regulator
MMASYPFSSTNLSGSLLLAHPGLLDLNFSRSVVLISSHSEEEGAWGAIINRPMGKTLGEFDHAFSLDPLGKVPLFQGGPVRADELILAAWQWREDEGLFRLLYGIDPDQARLLLADEDYTVRAFLGYSGWGKGQLEAELGQQSWVVTRIVGEALQGEQGKELWRDILSRMGPEMKLLADAPEDPSVN